MHSFRGKIETFIEINERKKKKGKVKLENLRRRIFLNYGYPFVFKIFFLSFNKKIILTQLT